MINLDNGATNSVWLSLRESLPAGYTQSNYKFTFTEPVSGSTKVFYPTATETGYKWSKFLIAVGTPEVLGTASSPRINMATGIWNYSITDTISSTELETGLVTVFESVTPTPSISRTKDVRTYKR